MHSDLYRRHVYILTNDSRVLYVGSTCDLQRRMYQHKTGFIAGFTSRYRVDRLVYFESHQSIVAAIAREREIKSWRRVKKIELIERSNAGWIDLAADWFPGLRRQDPSLRSG